ncbi:GNAT family N-acetyltransferase [Streptosporangium sp. NPDC048865]|uniref:GNAT family N-acetyltransferase n=1 Tax=Streptosporangium sp. NPDC048865 TaxID=3155766 RepID=UPI00342E62EA
MSDQEYQIRPMGPRDLSRAVELLNETSAHDVRRVLLSELTGNSTSEPFLAIVATRAGAVVGAAKLTADPVFPETVSALVSVDANARGIGIGSALVERMDTGPRLLKGGTATCSIRDDLPRGRAFAERHGFTVAHHSLGFRFDLTGSGYPLAERAAETAERAGVRIRRATVASEEDLILDCFTRCRIGLPLPYGNRPVDVRARLLQFPPESVYVLAESSDAGSARPAGMSILIPEGRNWYVRFTGTDPDFRGQGVATAVKAASLLYAQRTGAESVITHNDESNTPIIRANKALGMVPDVGYWSLLRDL